MSGLRGQITELIVIPAVAALLPWSWTYRLLRQLSRFSWLYREETELAEPAAIANGIFETGPVWRRHFRINKLIDGVDPWLIRFRSKRWMEKHLEVKGSWPTDGPFVALSIHWGAGMWGIRHIQHNSQPVSVIARPVSEWGTVFSTPKRIYIEFYEREIERAGGTDITVTGPGLTKRMANQIEMGHGLLALLDVPKGKNEGGFPVEFLGQPTYFATGIVNIAVKHNWPIVPYAIGVDFKTGKRQLEIRPPIKVADTHDAVTQLAAYFDDVVRREPTLWLFWNLHDAFLSSDFSQQ